MPRAAVLLWLATSWLVGFGTASSVGSSWVAESQALEHLRNSAEAAVLEDELHLLEICIERSWWVAAGELVSRAHVRGGGASTVLQRELPRLLGDVKRRADDFAAYAADTYRAQTAGLGEVHCALQWAQNSTTVFLAVKYAARWSAPGAIEVVDVKVNVTPCCFTLSGFGHHSNIRKHYVVNLDLFGDVLAASGTWSSAAVGRMTATLHKAVPGSWPRLLKTKDKTRFQVGKWLDMQEKWSAELASSVAKKSAANKQEKSTTVAPSASKRPSKKKLPFTLRMRKLLKRYSIRLKAAKMEDMLLIGLLVMPIFGFWSFYRQRSSEPSAPSARDVARFVAERRQALAEADRLSSANEHNPE